MTPDWVSTGKVLSVKEEITYRDLLLQNTICCSSVLIRTEVAKAFPMHHEDSHEDYIMWLEILQKYGSACGINEPLLRYRLSNTGKSGSKWKSARMTWKVYRYMGFSVPKSVVCFVAYAVNGVWKYYVK
jgi:teichuronic acid biosynthesis glycosyltransferase TuaG